MSTALTQEYNHNECAHLQLVVFLFEGVFCWSKVENVMLESRTFLDLSRTGIQVYNDATLVRCTLYLRVPGTTYHR